MASPDFYEYAARQRLQEISAQRAQALADLEQYKASADYQSAASSVQQIANLDAESRNIAALHQQYVASQTPPQQPELTREERFAKPLDRMDYFDVWDLVKDHGADLEKFKEGIVEVARRRAQGE